VVLIKDCNYKQKQRRLNISSNPTNPNQKIDPNAKPPVAPKTDKAKAPQSQAGTQPSDASKSRNT
jgi:hypothetical protein